MHASMPLRNEAVIGLAYYGIKVQRKGNFLPWKRPKMHPHPLKGRFNLHASTHLQKEAVIGLELWYQGLKKGGIAPLEKS